eukprot:765655-Amphidinium_carterae.6
MAGPIWSRPVVAGVCRGAAQPCPVTDHVGALPLLKLCIVGAPTSTCRHAGDVVHYNSRAAVPSIRGLAAGQGILSMSLLYACNYYVAATC